MNIDIERYIQVTLKDISKIYSSTGFLRMLREKGFPSTLHTLIHCPEAYVPGKMEVDLVETDGFLKGFVVIPKDGLNIVYLTGILNTAVSWAIMTDGKLEERTSITMKRLGNVLIRILPAQEQRAIAYLYYLLVDIAKLKKEGSSNIHLDYWKSVYGDLLNGIALELTIPKVFKDYEIELLSSWCSLIGKCAAEYPEFRTENWQDYLGKELLAPQNLVTGNINKLRVVMYKVTKQASDKK